MDPRRDPCPRCLRKVSRARPHPDKQCPRPPRARCSEKGARHRGSVRVPSDIMPEWAWEVGGWGCVWSEWLGQKYKNIFKSPPNGHGECCTRYGMLTGAHAHRWSPKTWAARTHTRTHHSRLNGSSDNALRHQTLGTEQNTAHDVPSYLCY